MFDVANLEKVATVRELTETDLGEAVIKRFAESVPDKKVTPLLVKALILKDYKGEMCAEFVRVVRAVVKGI